MGVPSCILQILNPVAPIWDPNSCTFHVHSCCWKHSCRSKVLSTTKKGQPLFWIWLVVSTCFNTFQLVAMSTMCIPKKICSSWRSPKLTRNWLWFSSFLVDPRTRPLAYELGCPLAVTVFPTCFFWCGRLPCCCSSPAGSAAPPRSQQWPGDWTHIQTDFHISTKAGTHHQHFQAIFGFWFQIVRLQRSSRWLTHPFLQFSKPYFIGWSGIILGFPSNELAVPSSQSPNPMHGVSVANLEHVLSQFHGEILVPQRDENGTVGLFFFTDAGRVLRSKYMNTSSFFMLLWGSWYWSSAEWFCSTIWLFTSSAWRTCWLSHLGFGWGEGSFYLDHYLTQPFSVWLGGRGHSTYIITWLSHLGFVWGGGVILLTSFLDSAI